MRKAPTIIAITDLRQDAATVLRQVRESKEPVVITQRGRAGAVMMSAEAYTRAEQDRELLRLLARGGEGDCCWKWVRPQRDARRGGCAAGRGRPLTVQFTPAAIRFRKKRNRCSDGWRNSPNGAACSRATQ
jgi:prevent-host-death family protein